MTSTRNAPSQLFADVPYTARGHLGLLFYEAAAHIVAHLESRALSVGIDPTRALHTVLDEFPFLGHYHEELTHRLPHVDAAGAMPRAMRRAVADWERGNVATGARLPLVDAKNTLALAPRAIVTLVTVGLVEEDAHFGALFAALQPLGNTRAPTIGLLRELMGGTGSLGDDDAWTMCRPLLDARLVEPVNRALPRSEWSLRVPTSVWSAVRGEFDHEPVPGVRWHASSNAPSIDELVISVDERRRIGEAAALLAGGDANALLVRGLDGAERQEVVAAIARASGRGLLSMEGVAAPESDAASPRSVMGALAALLHAMPTIIVSPAPGDTVDVAPLPGWRGPIALVLGVDGGIGGTAIEQAVTITLSPQPLAVRRQQWDSALGGDTSRDGDEVTQEAARTFALGGRHIRMAARLAKAHATVDGRDLPTIADVREGVRAVGRQQLDALATRLDDAGDWDTLVLPSGTARELQRLEQRCRHRERLVDALGSTLPGGLGRGVRALFEGPSGTGKTLAARVLASLLGVDLYRVDLAAVVNKYIGETEKNLGRVLARAEDLDVVLLLDEGDALLGKRTDVKSSNDRYANLETNYLLQRLESYAGIVIVTTNAARHIDPAFRRRMDAVVSFTLPDADARWQLWLLHLPADHAVSHEWLETVAVRHALTGGQIRVACVTATMLALADDRRVGAHDVMSAIDAEYRKSGGGIPVDRPRRGDHGEPSLNGLLGSIT